jgi:hypothetical protein
VFSSLLAEKKIIFLSSKLRYLFKRFRFLKKLFIMHAKKKSLLSNTIQAFETLLYPFNWPHTFIPVLPSYLIEMCDAPTPFLIGLMRSNIKLLSKYKGKKTKQKKKKNFPTPGIEPGPPA